MVYRRAGADWQPATRTPGAALGAGGAPSAPKSTELIDRLAGIVNTTPGLHDADDAIVAQELDQALQNIRLRLNRGDQEQLIVASGPAGGEYVRFVESLRPRSAKWSVTHATTAGSVENALLLDAGEARFGLVQSDVAAAAVTGRAAFTSHGPLRHLRAVTALFPEPVHVVVRAADGPATIADLRGKRVALGSHGSGTRQTAMFVLRAHGLQTADYVPEDTDSPEEALQSLIDGRVDAVIEVVSAPWSQLATAAMRAPLKLLPLDAAAVAALAENLPGLLPLAIPAHTYAWQQGNVPTLAATALLVAHADVADASVTRVLDFLFTSEQVAQRGASASRLSRARALAGVTIPLHEAAAEYFGPAVQ
jgi:TRAP transporter TAXI family solute receptor